MANRLADSNSPYLLQHKDNPVEWYPWGEEALARARSEGKPIFLSIGYAACHWCHVMEHESFEDERTAALMNEHFINIKVDREERPDLDNIYMNAVVAMTGQGGWPMSVFLTPGGEPFFGGTYFPPVRRYNMPSFQEVLSSVSTAWREDRERIVNSGKQLSEHLQRELSAELNPQQLLQETRDHAALALAQNYDWKNGGWGQAPKFPQPMALTFLAGRAVQGDKMAADLIVHALKAMAAGGMYDIVGGGFHRYSVDDYWLVPHFEKMLYDNAQLALAYLHGFLVAGEPEFEDICRATLDFVERELLDPAGGFYSSLDADSEGEEGIYYVWTPAELESILGASDRLSLLQEAYEISEAGNFEGRNILRRQRSVAEIAEAREETVQEVQRQLSEIHTDLLEARSRRVRPGTDDKVLTGWNGLMLRSFAEAARYLDDDHYLDVARQNARFLLENLYTRSRLLRSWRRGDAQHNAYLEDYGALILGLLALYQSEPEAEWFEHASLLTEEMVNYFWSADGGFYDTRHDHETLIVRPRDLQDNATPSGGGLATLALFKIAALSGNANWRDLAEKAAGAIQPMAVRYPTAFSMWLQALDFGIGPVNEVAIVGRASEDQTRSLTRVVWNKYRPRLVYAQKEPDQTAGPALLDHRLPVDGQPAAYVCQQFFCKAPVTSPEALDALLS